VVQMPYYIEPKPGYGPEDIVLNGLTAENAQIVKYEYGLPVEIHPFSQSNIDRYNAKPHPVLVREKGLFEREGRLITLQAVMFEGFLADGWNPFKQLICIHVTDRGGATKEDILSSILGRYLADTKSNKEYISSLVDYLSREGWLNAKMGYYVMGDRKMPIGKNRIAIREGYNPILDQIVKMIEAGRSTRSILSDYMIRDIGWIQYDPVLKQPAERLLDGYLSFLLRKGYIRMVGRNRYEVVKPLDRY